MTTMLLILALTTLFAVIPAFVLWKMFSSGRFRNDAEMKELRRMKEFLDAAQSLENSAKTFALRVEEFVRADNIGRLSLHDSAILKTKINEAQAQLRQVETKFNQSVGTIFAVPSTSTSTSKSASTDTSGSKPASSDTDSSWTLELDAHYKAINSFRKSKGKPEITKEQYKQKMAEFGVKSPSELTKEIKNKLFGHFKEL